MLWTGKCHVMSILLFEVNSLVLAVELNGGYDSAFWLLSPEQSIRLDIFTHTVYCRKVPCISMHSYFTSRGCRLHIYHRTNPSCLVSIGRSQQQHGSWHGTALGLHPGAIYYWPSTYYNTTVSCGRTSWDCIISFLFCCIIRLVVLRAIESPPDYVTPLMAKEVGVVSSMCPSRTSILCVCGPYTGSWSASRCTGSRLDYNHVGLVKI